MENEKVDVLQREEGNWQCYERAGKVQWLPVREEWRSFCQRPGGHEIKIGRREETEP